MCVCVCVLSHVSLFATPWTVSPLGSSVHLQERILEWVATSSSRGSSLTQERNPSFLPLLHGQADSLLLHHVGSPDLHI